MSIYNSGCVQVKTGSASIKGNSTNFVTYASSGYLFKLTSESAFYDIATIQNATNLTLTSRYANSDYQTTRSENVATMNTATKMSSGTLDYNPVIQSYVSINASIETFSDDSAGVLTGDASPAGSGTIDYDTGAWTITLGTDLTGTAVITASYYYGDTRNALSYQIVTDYTPNKDYPEMSLNDINFPHLYTKTIRMIDGHMGSNSFSNATIDNLYITYGLKKIVVTQTGADVTLVATDLNKVHNFTNAATCVVTIPEVGSGDTGAWIQCRKKSTAQLDIKRAGSNTIMDTATHITCAATAITSFVDLILENATNFGVQAEKGTWTTS